MQCSKLTSMLAAATCCAVVFACTMAAACASASGRTDSTAGVGFGELCEVAWITVEVGEIGIATLVG